MKRRRRLREVEVKFYATGASPPCACATIQSWTAETFRPSVVRPASAAA
jgi:hypothetical protein